MNFFESAAEAFTDVQDCLLNQEWLHHCGRESFIFKMWPEVRLLFPYWNKVALTAGCGEQSGLCLLCVATNGLQLHSTETCSNRKHEHCRGGGWMCEHASQEQVWPGLEFPRRVRHSPFQVLLARSFSRWTFRSNRLTNLTHMQELRLRQECLR